MEKTRFLPTLSECVSNTKKLQASSSLQSIILYHKETKLPLAFYISKASGWLR